MHWPASILAAKKKKNKALPCKHAQLCSPASPNIWIFLVEMESLGSWSACLALAQPGTCSVPFTSIPLQGIGPRAVLEMVSPRGFFFFFPWWCLGLIPWRKHPLPPLLPHPPPQPVLLHKPWSLFITPCVSTTGKSCISHVCKLFFASQGSYLTSFSYFKRRFFKESPPVSWDRRDPAPILVWWHTVLVGLCPKSLWNSNFCTASGSWFNARMPCNALRNVFFSSWTHSSACTEGKSLLWADSRQYKNALDTAT